MTRIIFLLAAAGLVALLTPAPVHAQDPASGGAETARVHLGPLGLTPRIALTNVGIDTNVLNQDTNPQRDFTMTFLPAVDSWLRIGRAQLSGKTGVELVYFRKMDAQRSFGFNQQGRLALNLLRLTPYVVGDYTDTARRPNAEIDARVQQTNKSVTGGASLLLGWRAVVHVAARQQRIAFSDDRFLGVSLAEALDRTSRTLTADLRLQLTPLTTFVVKNTTQRDRFTFSADRDTDSYSVVPGFEFKPLALISGTAFVGYRHFAPRRADRPVFSGAVASVALNYLARELTRFNGKVDRDIEYSIEPTEPYFVSTGGSLSMTQSLIGRWDAVVRAGRQRLDYRAVLLDGAAGAPLRRDRLVTFGTGLGYRLANDARVGFDINYGRRLSPVDARRYRGFQFGGSFTYGS